MEEGRGGGEWRTGVEGEGLWNVGGGRGRGRGRGRSTCPSLFCKPAPKALGLIYSPTGRLVKSLKITQLEGWRPRSRLWPSARALARREFANWSAGDFLPPAGNLCLGRLRPGQLDMQDSCLTAVSWGQKNNFKKSTSWRSLPYFRHNWGALCTGRRGNTAPGQRGKPLIVGLAK